MNAFVNAPTSTTTINLVGQNFSKGRDYLNHAIPLDFFADLNDEVEVQELTINGVSFGDKLQGYKEINAFIQAVENEQLCYPLQVYALLLQHDDLFTDVLDYAESNILAYSIDPESLGMSDLQEQYGSEVSSNALNNICEKLSSDQAKQVHIYWNHSQYIQDYFINEARFLKNATTHIIVSNR